MGSKTKNIDIGGTVYEVSRFTARQARELVNIFKLPTEERPVEIILLALQRTKPPIEKPEDIEIHIGQIADIVDAIMELKGMKTANPPEAAASYTRTFSRRSTAGCRRSAAIPRRRSTRW